MLIWKPKELIENSHSLLDYNNELQTKNQELIDANKKLDEIIKTNTNWYIQNINSLGQYLKDKHDDNYVFDQLRNVQGVEPHNEVKYDVDIILDKISVNGWTSLTQEEINYLKSQRHENK